MWKMQFVRRTTTRTAWPPRFGRAISPKHIKLRAACRQVPFGLIHIIITTLPRPSAVIRRAGTAANWARQHSITTRSSRVFGSISRRIDWIEKGPMRTLPDYLRRGMRLVIVGCNPGEQSARVGHYYAGRNNAFWKLLYESGIVSEELTHNEDRRLIEFGVGLTDIVKRSTR